MKRLMLAFAGFSLITMAAFAGPGKGPGNGSAPSIDEAIVFQGIVESVVFNDPQYDGSGPNSGKKSTSFFTLEGFDEKFVVGPVWYLDKNLFVMLPGDQLEIAAAPAVHADGYYLVFVLIKGDETLHLRDADGQPLWTGKKSKKAGYGWQCHDQDGDGYCDICGRPKGSGRD